MSPLRTLSSLALLAHLGCIDPPTSSSSPAVPLRPAPGPVSFARYDPPYPPAEALAEAAVADVPLPPKLKDWPIAYGPRREQLTADYLAAHVGPDAVTGDPAADSRMVPRVVILHWTAGGSARSAWFTFQPERRPRRPDLQGAKALNISAHFIVDRDGTTYRLMDEDRVGRHTIGLNHLSIGVENVGDGKRWPMTDDQITANIDLVRYLKARFPSITHLIGHHEYRAFEIAGHPYFQEHDTPRRTQKIDPGPAFMAAVRAGITDLNLLGPPPPPALDP